jgi:hypothetical protein
MSVATAVLKPQTPVVMGPRVRGDDSGDGDSKPCQSEALHLVSRPFGTPFWGRSRMQL